MKLIGCVSTHNDMDLLPGCLKGLADMDRVIVVDGTVGAGTKSAASTDGAVEYLTRLAAEDPRVTFVAAAEPWANKIAQRNAYLLGQEGDWYFVLEPFERCYGMSEVKGFLARATVDVFSIQQFPQPWANEPVLVQRLFKHLPGIRYAETPDRVVCDEKVLVDPSKPASLLTDQDPLIAPRVVSVMHKRLKGERTPLL